MDFLRHRDSSEGQQRRSQINILRQCVNARAGLDVAGPAHDERRLETFLIHPAFLRPTVFAGKKSLVGTVNDNGVAAETGFVEIGKDAADIFVQTGDGANIVLDEALVNVVDAVLAVEFSGGFEFLIFAVARVIDFVPGGALGRIHYLQELRHPLLRVRCKLFGSRRHANSVSGHATEFHPHICHEWLAGGVVVEERWRLRESHILIIFHVACRWCAGCVRGLKLRAEQKGF